MGIMSGFKGFRAQGAIDILARSGFANLLGFQMGGMRNLYAVFGWKQHLRFTDFYRKYKRHAIARRVVDTYPNALWADPPIVVGDSAFQTAWDVLRTEQPVFASLQKLDKLCRIGMFAVMVVGFDDGRKLDQPVANKKGRKIIYLQPYAECSVSVKTIEMDPASPRFRLPSLYTIYPGNFDLKDDSPMRGTLASETSFDVHWSRILHVAENALESNVYGSSCLEPIYNDLDDIEKISGGTAEVFWLNSNRGLHVDVDKEMQLDSGDADALEEEIDEYANNLRRVIRTRGVKINNLGTDFLDPSGPYNVPLSNIAAASGIPKRELMGSEAGQLASQQDRASFANRCDQRVSEYANPVVLMPFLRTLIDSGVLPVPKGLIVNWPDQFKMNPLERAQTSAQMARSTANLAKALFTVQQINHANAVDSQPQIATVLEQPEVAGLSSNLRKELLLLASTDPSKSKSGSPSVPSGKPSDAKGTGDASGSGDTSGTPAAPQVVEKPPLLPGAKTNLVLLTEEECRQIIGFGKHMPVFDSTQDSKAQIGTGDPQPPKAVAE